DGAPDARGSGGDQDPLACHPIADAVPGRTALRRHAPSRCWHDASSDPSALSALARGYGHAAMTRGESMTHAGLQPALDLRSYDGGQKPVCPLPPPASPETRFSSRHDRTRSGDRGTTLAPPRQFRRRGAAGPAAALLAGIAGTPARPRGLEHMG